MDLRAAPLVPASWGEILDKIAILEIKNERIAGKAALANIRRELEALRNVVCSDLAMTPDLLRLRQELHVVNEALWVIEDAIREKERDKAFDSEFIELARAIYRQNDRRASLKKAINTLTGSLLSEEKSYSSCPAS